MGLQWKMIKFQCKNQSNSSLESKNFRLRRLILAERHQKVPKDQNPARRENWVATLRSLSATGLYGGVGGWSGILSPQGTRNRDFLAPYPLWRNGRGGGAAGNRGAGDEMRGGLGGVPPPPRDTGHSPRSERVTTTDALTTRALQIEEQEVRALGCAGRSSPSTQG